MSIVNMQRVAVIGLEGNRDKLMAQLLDFEGVELSDQTAKLSDEAWDGLVKSEENQSGEASFTAEIDKATVALEVIDKYGKLKHPLFMTRRRVKRAQLDDMVNNKDTYRREMNEILELNEKLSAASDKINKLEQEIISLRAWKNYDLPLELTGTRTTAISIGVLPMGTDIAQVSEELDSKVPQMSFKVVDSDKDMYYVAAIYDREKEEAASEILKKYGFSPATIKDFKGTPAENIQRMEEETQSAEKDKQDLIDEIASKANYKEDIENYSDVMAIEYEKEAIKARILTTKSAFFIEGWVPKRIADQAKKILDDNNCFYQFKDPEEGEEVPVLLDNPKAVVPFEEVMEMYSLPSYWGFDPTKIFSIFYAIFFGMMLSDAGYGIVMAVACFIVLKKFDLEGNMYKMIKMFFYCGISTTFWGAMFGGWFGDFFTVFARNILGKEIIIKPLWFNPIDDPIKLFIFSLILGVIHIFVGMGIKCYMQIKEGKWLDAVFDQGFWYMVISGIPAWIFGDSVSPIVSKVGMWMVILGAVGLLVTGGRNSKNVFGKIVGGLGSIYNITSYLSDILSYARVLALGLATGVIAQVVNTMGSLFGSGILGLLLLLIIFVVGHILNLAINVLGAFIHSSRLQYIEFFGKFFEDGGEPFDPYRRKTKYIRLCQ